MITLQALAADGTWHTRNAFTDQNKLVTAGLMTREALIELATDMQRRWNATHENAGTMRVHDDAVRAAVETKTYELEGCTDCVMYLANGDVPEDDNGWSPEAVEASWPSATYHLCAAGDENSEEYFSWRACDVCGSRLGGNRYPVAAWCDDVAA